MLSELSNSLSPHFSNILGCCKLANNCFLFYLTVNGQGAQITRNLVSTPHTFCRAGCTISHGCWPQLSGGTTLSPCRPLCTLHTGQGGTITPQQSRLEQAVRKGVETPVNQVHSLSNRVNMDTFFSPTLHFIPQFKLKKYLVNSWNDLGSKFDVCIITSSKITWQLTNIHVAICRNTFLKSDISHWDHNVWCEVFQNRSSGFSRCDLLDVTGTVTHCYTALRPQLCGLMLSWTKWIYEGENSIWKSVCSLTGAADRGGQQNKATVRSCYVRDGGAHCTDALATAPGRICLAELQPQDTAKSVTVSQPKRDDV